MTRTPVATYSIVAYDPDTKSLGVAVQSKFLAAGSIVPWAKAGVGAVATQAWANASYGPEGLRLLAEGYDPQSVARLLTEHDEGRNGRQFGIIDAQGNAHAFTGEECLDWSGHVVGPHFACQGNLLAGEAVVQGMASAFQNSEGDFTDRLLAALEGGQAHGGDRRGKQSASLLVVREGAGYGGFTDRYIDLRVDDHPRPITELKRLVALFRLHFEKDETPELLTLAGDVLATVQDRLVALGYLESPSGTLDPATKSALRAYHGTENFEERIHGDDVIDKLVYEFLKTGTAPK